MRTLILSTFLYACESWTLTAEIERRIQALEMRCYRRLLNISYKDHVTNEEVRNRIQNAIGMHDDLLTILTSLITGPGEWLSFERVTSNNSDSGKETETQMVWPHLKILWHGEDNSARDSDRSKKETKTEEEIKEWTGMGFLRFPEGSGRQERMERYCCNIICGAPTISKVKGLRWDEMRWDSTNQSFKQPNYKSHKKDIAPAPSSFFFNFCITKDLVDCCNWRGLTGFFFYSLISIKNGHYSLISKPPSRPSYIVCCNTFDGYAREGA